MQPAAQPANRSAQGAHAGVCSEEEAPMKSLQRLAVDLFNISALERQGLTDLGPEAAGKW